ncbi:MAG TPA: hypothetical protein VK501_10825 [Baekduia sp.]|uniref:hypothetical protein n=1 Tax=Baekduia sp. TaxID=2600305 RepID=UPI002C37BE82|nr:hypothetical protein [Baekduia sp.]HMJ34399.1 hypothetical protein [Baekduia sp.]
MSSPDSLHGRHLVVTGVVGHLRCRDGRFDARFTGRAELDGRPFHEWDTGYSFEDINVPLTGEVDLDGGVGDLALGDYGADWEKAGAIVTLPRDIRWIAVDEPSAQVLARRPPGDRA